MRDLVLVTNDHYSLDDMKNILEKNITNPVVHQNEKCIWLEFKEEGEFFGEHVQIEETSDPEYLYESSELNDFKKTLLSLQFYYVSFKDINHVKLVLKFIADRDDIFIDNDFGLILSGKDFIKMCEKNPNWDWAYDDEC